VSIKSRSTRIGRLHVREAPHPVTMTVVCTYGRQFSHNRQHPNSTQLSSSNCICMVVFPCPLGLSLRDVFNDVSKYILNISNSLFRVFPNNYWLHLTVGLASMTPVLVPGLFSHLSVWFAYKVSGVMCSVSACENCWSIEGWIHSKTRKQTWC